MVSDQRPLSPLQDLVEESWGLRLSAPQEAGERWALNPGHEHVQPHWMRRSDSHCRPSALQSTGADHADESARRIERPLGEPVEPATATVLVDMTIVDGVLHVSAETRVCSAS